VVPPGPLRPIRHRRLIAAPLLWGTALGGGLLAGCGGDNLVLPTGQSAKMIRVVQGDGQQGTVGQLLPAPIVVLVTDSAGTPISGAAVQFVLLSAGDSADIEPATTTTDQQGQAQARMLLGDKVGLQTGEARLGQGADLQRAPFTAVAGSQTGNQAPDAGFDWHCDQLVCQFTDGSTDADGSVTGWSWDFGDGASSDQQSPAHTYAAAGSYTVTLTVTDNQGATAQASRQVTAGATPQNQPPHAEFDLHCDQLTCGFTDRSTDDHGITAWAWDFGDGTSSTEPNPTHTYSSSGTFHVRLTVTDADGATDNRTHDAHAEAAPPPPANQAPQADFDVHCHHLDCSFTDRSTDADGVVVSWHWDFGDGTTSIQPSPDHTYARRGHYQVSLTVTDDDGASDTRTHTADAKR
jgi:PKD repeat protein